MRQPASLPTCLTFVVVVCLLRLFLLGNRSDDAAEFDFPVNSTVFTVPSVISEDEIFFGTQFDFVGAAFGHFGHGAWREVAFVQTYAIQENRAILEDNRVIRATDNSFHGVVVMARISEHDELIALWFREDVGPTIQAKPLGNPTRFRTSA